MAKAESVRGAADAALLQIFRSLFSFAIDVGLSVREVESLLRLAAVQRVVADRRQRGDKRTNKSSVAATTGLPRSAVSNLLSERIKKKRTTERKQSAMSQLLSYWHKNPRFVDDRSQPATLRIYGRGRTFEHLARKFGKGVPTRALLDELLRIGAVELVNERMVRANALVPVERGLNVSAISTFGDRASNLIDAMLANIREQKSGSFVASVSAKSVREGLVPLVRREIVRKSSNFLADVQDMMTEESSTVTKRRGTAFRVTVFSNEEKAKVIGKRRVARKNLRRS